MVTVVPDLFYIWTMKSKCVLFKTPGMHFVDVCMSICKVCRRRHGILPVPFSDEQFGTQPINSCQEGGGHSHTDT